MAALITSYIFYISFSWFFCPRWFDEGHPKQFVLIYYSGMQADWWEPHRTNWCEDSGCLRAHCDPGRHRCEHLSTGHSPGHDPGRRLLSRHQSCSSRRNHHDQYVITSTSYMDRGEESRRLTVVIRSLNSEWKSSGAERRLSPQKCACCTVLGHKSLSGLIKSVELGSQCCHCLFSSLLPNFPQISHWTAELLWSHFRTQKSLCLNALFKIIVKHKTNLAFMVKF